MEEIVGNSIESGGDDCNNDYYIDNHNNTSRQTSNDEEIFPPIRLIDFDLFADRTSFPRYPDNQELCTTLDDIDRDHALVIFISHVWMRKQPDNTTNEKFKLTIDGIQRIKAMHAPGMSQVYRYILMDYGCINQDGNPAGELKQLDEIIRHCDLIFTPIFDEHPDAWDIPPGWINMYTQYLSPNWSSGKTYGYVNLGWCRVEMFYAANIPTTNSLERIERFAAGLKYHHASNGVRPHVLYGSKDVVSRLNP